VPRRLHLHRARFLRPTGQQPVLPLSREDAGLSRQARAARAHPARSRQAVRPCAVRARRRAPRRSRPEAADAPAAREAELAAARPRRTLECPDMKTLLLIGSLLSFAA